MDHSLHEKQPGLVGESRGVHLTSTFTPLGIWAFSIGTSIGWGSFIVTCNTYLQKAGLLGTALGLVLGTAVILVIAWNLQAMITKAPDAGGIYAFEKRMGGKDMGFLAFWFVLLTYLAILWANMTSLPLFARFFLGDAFRFGFRYQIFGYDVWLGEVLLSSVALSLVGFFCSRTARLPNRIMIACALTFAVSFTLCAILVVLRHDSAFSFSPLYVEGSSGFSQIVRIAAISPWAFIGFENISHFSEEYAFPTSRVRGVLIWSVVATTVLYLFVSLLSVSAYPPEYESWLAYIKDMGNLGGIKAVPAFYVVDHYLGGIGVGVLMVALFAVILSSLIGNMLALSRLLFAAGREGDAPSQLAVLNEKGVPARAIGAVVLLSLFIPFLGRTAIGWIVDVTTLCATLIYGLISHAVYLSAKRDGERTQVLSGLVGMAFMFIFMLLLLVPGLFPSDAMATESYFLFIAWSLLGLIYFRQLLKRERGLGENKGIIVWVVLLMLILFASMMWVSRATEHAANQAVERIYQYHEEHPGMDDEAQSASEREQYLQEQARTISGTNTLYSVVSLGLVLLSILILGDSFRENRRLGQRLSDAEREAETARKIAELKESINALLDNMPLMSFSKDADTGVYLACNQAFAEYAGKKVPDQVVGLTDAEIFSPEVAAHFVEDDRRALLMETPLVVIEDVADATGNPRQFQTTKLKFFDTSGRLCLLGMSMELTEIERIRRESERAQVAYQEAVTTSTIYESIIDSLAEDYFNLFYIDLVTDDYIEYGSRTEEGQRSLETRGTDFFGTSQTNANDYVYEEDQQHFIEAMDKERLVSEIAAHGTFIMQYRLNIAGRPTYVNLKATRIKDNERYMIIGVNNIDAQVRERAAAQKVRDEHRTYARISALNGNIILLYFVDPTTSHYTEYSSSTSFDFLGLAKQGADFFEETRRNSTGVVHPEDQELFCTQVTRENVLATVERDGVFSIGYRIVGQDLPTYVRLKVARVVEGGRPIMIVGLLDEDAQVRREQEYARSLSQAQMRATRDQLTGVKNKHAYVDAERELEEAIATQADLAFAIVVCDINDLKLVNDTEGHMAGDLYIKSACSIICDVFKHSPVFRIGGDEFAVICRGHDYGCLDELMETMESRGGKGASSVQIACGAARFGEGQSVEAVFALADTRMYGRKAQMKAADNSAR